MQQIGKTYYWRLNHNDDKGMCMIHLPDECKASDKPNTWFPKPAKFENDNRTAEKGNQRLKWSENLQAYLMSDMKLSKNKVNKIILGYTH